MAGHAGGLGCGGAADLHGHASGLVHGAIHEGAASATDGAELVAAAVLSEFHRFIAALLGGAGKHVSSGIIGPSAFFFLCIRGQQGAALSGEFAKGIVLEIPTAGVLGPTRDVAIKVVLVAVVLQGGVGGVLMCDTGEAQGIVLVEVKAWLLWKKIYQTFSTRERQS